jgi:hypothetical protein
LVHAPRTANGRPGYAGSRPAAASPKRRDSALSAAFGACFGCYSALIAVHLSSGLWHYRVNRTDTVLFLLTLVLGTIGAFLTAHRYRTGSNRPLLSTAGLFVWLLLFAKRVVPWTLEAQRGGRWIFWPICLAGAGLVLLWLGLTSDRHRRVWLPQQPREDGWPDGSGHRRAPTGTAFGREDVPCEAVGCRGGCTRHERSVRFVTMRGRGLWRSLVRARSFGSLTSLA